MCILTLTVFLSLTPSDLMRDVQATYQRAGDMTASFKQTYVDKLRGKKRVETGTLWVKKDGRVRWTYSAPQRKDFIFDGTTAYFYEPDNAQVTLFERFADSPVATAMQFLWGRGDLSKSFEVQACDAACAAPSAPGAKAGEVAVRMVPRQAIAAVDHAVVWVDEKAQRVRRSVIYDPLGNVTEYAFADVALGAALEDSKFAFTVPEGVSVLRATAEGSSAPAPASKKPERPGEPR